MDADRPTLTLSTSCAVNRNCTKSLFVNSYSATITSLGGYPSSDRLETTNSAGHTNNRQNIWLGGTTQRCSAAAAVVWDITQTTKVKPICLNSRRCILHVDQDSDNTRSSTLPLGNY